MPRLVSAKDASLAVIPPASALAQFITHREMPLYIAWYCEHEKLNNAIHIRTGPAALPTVQRAASSARAPGCEGGGRLHGSRLLQLC